MVYVYCGIGYIFIVAILAFLVENIIQPSKNSDLFSDYDICMTACIVWPISLPIIIAVYAVYGVFKLFYKLIEFLVFGIKDFNFKKFKNKEYEDHRID